MVDKFRPFMGRKNLGSRDTSEAALSRAFKENLSDIVQNFQDFVDHINGATPEILVEALEPTLGKAIEYCPKDTHELVNSAYLEVESYRGQHVIAIGFGRGGKPDYAIFVHEMPFKHEEPTRSKFLEAALDEDYFSILNSIPRLVREAAGT